MKITRFLFLLVFPLYLFSCRTSKPIPNILQNVSDTTAVPPVTVQDLRIQKNDLLSIQVYSASTKPEVSDIIYNLPSASGTASGSSGGGGGSTGGFLVDSKGDIEYPRIGIIRAEGLTKYELADIIKKRINEKDSVLTNPSVIIRYLNLKVTVMGEVNNPTVLSVPSEKITIMEAIGLAGGINDFGLKDQVKVIREIDGKREVGMVNLTDKSVFSSPYYLLQQNDVVLIDPTRKKAKKAETDVVLQRAAFGLSVITAIALLYNIF